MSETYCVMSIVHIENELLAPPSGTSLTVTQAAEHVTGVDFISQNKYWKQ